MRHAVLVALLVAGVAGCATIRAADTRSTEEMLSAAGFHREAADTPERRTQLESLPPRRIAMRTSNGQTSYVYPDPDVCRCLYVGTEPQYQQYQKLRLQQDLADRNAVETWDDWPGSWWP